jgi:hypothetical protein
VPGRFGGFARSVTGSHTVKNEEEMGLQNSRCFFQDALFAAQAQPSATRRVLRRFNGHSASIISVEVCCDSRLKFVYHIPLGYRQGKCLISKKKNRSW